jgi:hypothetical protein
MTSEERFSHLKREHHQSLMSKFPAETEQGIFLHEQGILSREQGILRPGSDPTIERLVLVDSGR